MPPSADDKTGKDPLEPVLRDVEAELTNRLREACEAEADGVSSESTAEIRRLENSLLAAAVAAEQTITLRRHIEQRRSDASSQPEAAGGVPDESPQPLLKLREFRDAEGRLWRAWPVTPGHARQGRSAERYLGEFHKGWVCFESLENNARRRLPSQPERWADLQESELCRLLDQAINAPERKGQRDRAGEAAQGPVH